MKEIISVIDYAHIYLSDNYFSAAKKKFSNIRVETFHPSTQLPRSLYIVSARFVSPSSRMFTRHLAASGVKYQIYLQTFTKLAQQGRIQLMEGGGLHYR